MTEKFQRELYTGDNLVVLRGMNSAIADLIYLDPPFNSGKQWENPIQAQGRKAMASFKDTWTLQDINKDEHELLSDEYPELASIIEAMGVVNGGSWKSYMIYMAVRLVEMKRILKPTGSVYLHCDPTMSHGLKLAMDAIFGVKNFRNEIVWHYSGWNARLKKNFISRHDILFFYGRGNKSIFNSYGIPWEDEQEYLFTRRQRLHTDSDGRKYVLSDAGDGQRVKRYLDEAMQYGRPVSSVWGIDKINNSSQERTGYPTQKPLALLERIVIASSNEGDVVLDPFCGCATACIAAERLKRQWIGIDISATAADIVKRRLENSCNILFDAVSHFTKPPKRTDITDTRTPNAKLRPILYRKQKGRCAAPCEDGKKGVQIPERLMHIDHIVASAKGGLDVDKNLQLLCGNCNSVKGARGMRYLKRKLHDRQIRQYDSRTSDEFIGGGEGI